MEFRDKVVQQVVEKFAERSNKGVEVYGTTLDENNVDDFLTHAQEEAMDFVLYLQKLKNQLRDKDLIL